MAAPRIGCIILAAGRSKRFGRARVNKLLVPLRGRALIRHVLCAVLRSAARPIVVVTGYQHARIVRALSPLRATRWRVRFNRHHRRGMSTSLQLGLAALPGDIDGVLVCLGDMPMVRAQVIDALIGAFEPGDDAVIARAGGRRGNPVLLGRSLLPAIASLSGDAGARRLLQDPRRRLRFVDTGEEVLSDIDTRRDWRRARALAHLPMQKPAKI